jgi:transcription factor S
MKFCKKCGSLMMPKKDGSKASLVCTQCGNKDKESETEELKEAIKGQEKIEVVEEDKDIHMPLVDQECPECGHQKSFFWTVQTRASDEPETKFFKCEKCKHTWRDYS